ncbi:hypothetical protein AVEN_103773-2-1, partial [Araneus ventricosus]
WDDEGFKTHFRFHCVCGPDRRDVYCRGTSIPLLLRSGSLVGGLATPVRSDHLATVKNCEVHPEIPLS